jgi:cell division protein FtsB
MLFNLRFTKYATSRLNKMLRHWLESRALRNRVCFVCPLWLIAIRLIVVFSADNNDILRRLASIEERFGSEIADLKQENVGLRHEVKELMRVNAGLQHEVEEQGRVIYGLKDDNAQLKRDNAQLKDDNAQLKDDNAQLKRDNAQLKHDFKELRSQMEETNRAVLGVRPIILLYHFSHSHLGLTG